ncbi:3-oxoacyl-[acyl-carrier-protein] synthase III C-terminal domain-containing protein [Streptomyces sp. NPDC001401]|uniref:3-oxoacyl-[acyl-carrier-protein] synthase III C-terminal domain-containing protein n=1 Tax=Streptomyces sp. NPDC001401 TaxID=3364570 RepID=UPI00368ED753
MPAYITAMGRFLPGDPVPNEEIEDYIGSVGAASSLLRERILDSCGITSRYYAIDKQRRTLFSNTDMAVAAVRQAVDRSGITVDDIDLIAAGTAVPDLIAPGIASGIHGQLGGPPCEIVTTHGICSTGMMALKNAYLQVAAGEKKNAIACASELASRFLKSDRFADVRPISEDGAIAMEMAFLRYMLSDGAGAALVQDRPAAGGVSLRIDWISLTSYASTEQTCMYMGAADGAVDGGAGHSWWDYPSAAEAAVEGTLALRQNLGLLPHLVRIGVREYQRLLKEGRFDPDELAWFPAHYSSERMKSMVLKEIERKKVRGPSVEKWYSNLTRVGNMGSASIYVILEEMLREGLVAAGDKLLVMVPESGRFAVSFAHLTAVGAGFAEEA